MNLILVRFLIICHKANHRLAQKGELNLNAAFKDAINDYLETCKKEGVKPQKPFKGNFNVRTGSDLHRRAALFAQDQDSNLNKVVIEALENYLPPKAA